MRAWFIVNGANAALDPVEIVIDALDVEYVRGGVTEDARTVIKAGEHVFYVCETPAEVLTLMREAEKAVE